VRSILKTRFKVAFLGPSGAFTQHAVFRHFGESIDELPRRVETTGAVAATYRPNAVVLQPPTTSIRMAV
jgi:prephenate dehydratase